MSVFRFRYQDGIAKLRISDNLGDLRNTPCASEELRDLRSEGGISNVEAISSLEYEG